MELVRILAEDLRTVVERDQSVRHRGEAFLHPALPAVWTHRVAHLLHRCGLRLTARFLMVLVRAFTGMDLHPGEGSDGGSSSTMGQLSSSGRPRGSAMT